MSAILAGKSCKKCNSEWYVSFGHPKWYDDVVKRRLPASITYSTFRDCQSSGLCPKCWLVDLIERVENKPDEFPLQFVQILVSVLGIVPK